MRFTCRKSLRNKFSVNDKDNRSGYRVHMVDSGEAALDYLNTHEVDLMLLDMIMPPGMNGRETVESDRWRHYLLEAKKLRIM